MAFKQSSTHYFQVETTTIAYRKYGQSHNPTLLLVSGLAESGCYFWQPLIDHFVDHYQIITFDLLGHGDSTRPLRGYHTARQLHLYAQFIEAVCGEPVVLIGHSLGGVIGASLAAKYPALIRRLILYDSPIPRGPVKNVALAFDMRPLAFIAMAPLAIPGMGLFLDVVTSRKQRVIATRRLLSIWRVPFNRRGLTDVMVHHLSQTTVVALEQQLRSFFLYFDLQRQLKSLQTPTMIIAGDNDVLLSTKRAHALARVIPHCQIKIIPHAGHLALFDQPTVFLEGLEHFLMDLEFSRPL